MYQKQLLSGYKSLNTIEQLDNEMAMDTTSVSRSLLPVLNEDFKGPN